MVTGKRAASGCCCLSAPHSLTTPLSGTPEKGECKSSQGRAADRAGKSPRKPQPGQGLSSQGLHPPQSQMQNARMLCLLLWATGDCFKIWGGNKSYFHKKTSKCGQPRTSNKRLQWLLTKTGRYGFCSKPSTGRKSGSYLGSQLLKEAEAGGLTV